MVFQMDHPQDALSLLEIRRLPSHDRHELRGAVHIRFGGRLPNILPQHSPRERFPARSVRLVADDSGDGGVSREATSVYGIVGIIYRCVPRRIRHCRRVLLELVPRSRSINIEHELLPPLCLARRRKGRCVLHHPDSRPQLRTLSAHPGTSSTVLLEQWMEGHTDARVPSISRVGLLRSDLLCICTTARLPPNSLSPAGPAEHHFTLGRCCPSSCVKPLALESKGIDARAYEFHKAPDSASGAIQRE